MLDIAQRLANVRERIRRAELAYGRQVGSVSLLAVSKTHTPEEIQRAVASGQLQFGENYLQEALAKIEALGNPTLGWHFIGRIQSNKTRAIAEHFAWVHSLSSLRHAQRLDGQRPASLPPLKVCLQVNVSGEASKEGLEPDQVPQLLAHIAQLQRLEICGLMAIPAPMPEFAAQRDAFARLRRLRDRVATPDRHLPILSMGMSGDLEAAIAAGSTLVRVGTAIFGPRS